MLCGRLDERGVWGRKDTCTYMTESLCCLPETVTTLLIFYTSVQNKKFFKKVNVKNIHTFGGLQRRDSLSQHFGGQKSKVLAGPHYPGRSNGRICSLPLLKSGADSIPWLVVASLPLLYLFRTFSDLNLSRPLSYKETPDCSRTTQMIHMHSSSQVSELNRIFCPQSHIHIF